MLHGFESTISLKCLEHFVLSPAGQSGESGTLCQESGGGEGCQTGITAGQTGRRGGQKGGNCEGEEVKSSPGLYIYTSWDPEPNAHLLFLYPKSQEHSCHPTMCTHKLGITSRMHLQNSCFSGSQVHRLFLCPIYQDHITSCCIHIMAWIYICVFVSSAP